MAFKFSTEFWKEYTKPRYSKRDMALALKRQEKEYTVNRVIRSFTGRIGPNESEAMQILAIHKTPEGLLIIVK